MVRRLVPTDAMRTLKNREGTEAGDELMWTPEGDLERWVCGEVLVIKVEHT